MNKMILSLGSNSSDREWQMKQAIKQIKQLFTKVVLSEIYEVAAHNGIDAPYLNAVAVASTNMSLDEVNVACKQWETICGRTPASKIQGVIPIDIDVVAWNGEIVRETDYSREYVAKGIVQLLNSLL